MVQVYILVRVTVDQGVYPMSTECKVGVYPGFLGASHKCTNTLPFPNSHISGVNLECSMQNIAFFWAVSI